MKTRAQVRKALRAMGKMPSQNIAESQTKTAISIALMWVLEDKKHHRGGSDESIIDRALAAFDEAAHA